MIRTWEIGYGKDGAYQIGLRTAPARAVLVDAAFETLIEVLGHPCCDEYPDGRQRWAGWVSAHLPAPLKGPWQVAQFRLINNRVSRYGYAHSHEVARLPLTQDQAQAVDPTFVAAMAQMMEDD